MRIGIDIDNCISNFNDVLLENDDFYYNNIQRIAMSLKPLNNAKEVIDKLKADGNEIYIITSSDNGEYINPEKMTRKWLEKYENIL